MPRDGFSSFDPGTDRKGTNPVVAGLWFTVLLLLGFSAYFAWSGAKANQTAKGLGAEVDSLSGQLADLRRQAERDQASLLATHQAEMERVNREWGERLAQVEAEHTTELKQSAQNLSEIVAQVVNESGTTIQYMEDLQARVKAGEELQASEVTRLTAVANGLAYLHRQYEKPIQEFRELETFLERQLQMPDGVPPEEKGQLLKRIFSRQFRDDQRSQSIAYYRDQGRREALEVARDQVELVYGRAQEQMDGLKVNYDDYLANLQAIIEGKESSTEVMASFFDVSGKILEIHQRVMDMQIEPVERTPGVPETIEP